MKNIYLILLLLVSSSGFTQTKELSNNELVSLCKVWGTMKYYQPAISQGKIDWDNVLFTTLTQQKIKKQTVDEIIDFWFESANKEILI